MRERAQRAAGARGVRRAREVIEFADGRAELPGESVSRLQLHRIGFRNMDLQVAVAGPHGSTYFVDIGLGDVRTFWEFDGEVKYRDAAMRGGRSIETVLLDEKRREDWIRGATQWRLCRGDSATSARPRRSPRDSPPSACALRAEAVRRRPDRCRRPALAPGVGAPVCRRDDPRCSK